ncbi:MAG: ATP-binding cassette domain-containing protein [Spirochaetales bacterium]|uniref:ATP-binding cassette domain-containing protein n=1 Tax=Candidatus Thalassospirochaeta sargassi TaxID=3119039 RepID=A0AAJ1IE64_9SPIO|nr:ATP-binding cassette domain-containing protein [Spirochaetales bacterium]
MIKLEKINMIFGEGTPDRNHVLRDVDLQINKGDFITIIGSNGAGKTTLFNVVSGNKRPSSGKVIVNNKDVTNHPEYKRAKYIGRIFQDPLLGTAGNMSISDNMLVAGNKGFKGLKISLNRKKREYFREQLKYLDIELENRMSDNVGMLSGGQRQALTLLMMSLSRPELVLLDEHTAALDPRNASKVMELTDKFIDEYGFTVMMITHNMQHAIDNGNRLLMMDEGRIILDISGEEKNSMTVESLIKKFHDIRNKDFATDKTLLS